MRKGGLPMSKIVFIGAGSMAEAMISGLIEKKMYSGKEIIVTNRSNDERLQELSRHYGVTTSRDYKKILKKASVVVLAFKPKDVVESLSLLKEDLSSDHLVISVIAGVSTDSITNLLGFEGPVIRAMPNTSASIGQSATAITSGNWTNDKHEQLARALFEAIGKVITVDEEAMHLVTGLSGSGPAYFYYMIEAMQDAAVQEGMTEETARELIFQTFVGAAGMVKASNKTPRQLRKEITSPNGTTEAGIKMLQQEQFKESISSCIKTAKNRSEEMGKDIEERLAASISSRH
jgi:pyrroline-5-carboxylate reductase